MERMNRPGVGTGVFVFKNNTILMQKRTGSFGADSWSLPGGHLEYGEAIEACAAREVLEETSVKINNITFLAITNDFFESEGKHYITIFLKSDYESGEAKPTDDKSTETKWFSLSELPENLFLPLKNFLNRNSYPKDWKF